MDGNSSYLNNIALVRAVEGSIFSYSGYGGTYGTSGTASPGAVHFTRAVVVVGEGL